VEATYPAPGSLPPKVELTHRLGESMLAKIRALEEKELIKQLRLLTADEEQAPLLALLELLLKAWVLAYFC